MTRWPKDRGREQLERYAEDLQRLSLSERDAAAKVDAITAQLDAYAIDLRKAVDRERARARDAEEAYHESLLQLARSVDLRDCETGEHAQRLADYAGILCDALGLSREEKSLIRLAAPLHDLGKVGVPDNILLKPGPLDESERKVVRSHCSMGASLLRGTSAPWLRTARDAALTHHECWDGSGYPRGLRGEAIPLCGRIIKVADCYDVARSTRPHKGPTDPDIARRALLDGDRYVRPEHFDPKLLDIFDAVHPAFDEIFSIRGGQ